MFANAHPSPSLPSRFSSNASASSKNTSQNRSPPQDCFSVRTVIPGVSIAMTKHEMPLCLAIGPVGLDEHHAPLRELRAAGPQLLTGDPVARSVPLRVGGDTGEVGPGAGLTEPLAPLGLALQEWHEESFGVGRRCRTAEGAPEPAERSDRVRDAGDAELLVDDRLEQRALSSTTPLFGPAESEPSAAVEGPMPRHPEGAARPPSRSKSGAGPGSLLRSHVRNSARNFASSGVSS